MIPERFSVEIAGRLRNLYEATADAARAADLTTTHALAIAMPLLIVPLERLGRGATMNEGSTEPRLVHEFHRVKRLAFSRTPFWSKDDAHKWRFAVVDGQGIDFPGDWRTSANVHPCQDEAAFAGDSLTEDILLTMRHGLAHGNVVYLDESGQERPNRRATQLAFVAKTRPSGQDWDGRYRVVVVEESAFVRFLMLWSSWMAALPSTGLLRLAA